MMTSKVIWKDVAGFEGLYQVSNLGEVKSLISNKILSPSKKEMGIFKLHYLKKVIENIV